MMAKVRRRSMAVAISSVVITAGAGAKKCPGGAGASTPGGEKKLTGRHSLSHRAEGLPRRSAEPSDHRLPIGRWGVRIVGRRLRLQGVFLHRTRSRDPPECTCAPFHS